MLSSVVGTCSASDRQGSNFESCVWRTVSSHSSHHPQEVLLAQFSLYVHKGGLKPDSFHFCCWETAESTSSMRCMQSENCSKITVREEGHLVLSPLFFQQIKQSATQLFIFHCPGVLFLGHYRNCVRWFGNWRIARSHVRFVHPM